MWPSLSLDRVRFAQIHTIIIRKARDNRFNKHALVIVQTIYPLVAHHRCGGSDLDDDDQFNGFGYVCAVWCGHWPHNNTIVLHM